jgi:hypothetical protein
LCWNRKLAGELGDAGAGTPGATHAAAGCSTTASSRLQRNVVVEHSSLPGDGQQDVAGKSAMFCEATTRET